MKKKQFIRDMSVGATIECYFIITKAEKKLSKANTPYWDIQLKDATGVISAKIWHPVSSTILEIPKESFVSIKALVESYNGALQLKIESLDVLLDSLIEELDMGDFVPSSQYPIEHMWNELIALCTEVFTHKPWYTFTIDFFSTPEIMKTLRYASAAKSMHHAYRGGLLEHMLSVANLCRRLAAHYPEIDEQLLVAGALFHDIGKIVELEGFLTTEYTTEGKLLGHITQGVELITPYMQKANVEKELQIQLKHLILSHHGYLEFGSPKVPQTAEAYLLHHADNIDAKMEIFRSLFSDIEPSEEAWKRVHNMGDLFHPISTSVFEEKMKSAEEQHINKEQLSLLK
ncbi:MAG: HD domain-containing protein [Desulfovibrionaceae bacterium]|nr:HD domain-containing protein [Desulfovibrionaceae bacterium]